MNVLIQSSIQLGSLLVESIGLNLRRMQPPQMLFLVAVKMIRY